MNALCPMPDPHASRCYKVVVCFESRPDGGLRAWSDQVPGLVLSNRDPDKVLAGVVPALEFILSEHLGHQINAQPLDQLRLELEDAGLIEPTSRLHPEKLEYVALQA